MASGIYRLTFLTGDTYIGKSVDLEQRWQQHAIKLEKGTAARQMLTAFFESGYTLPKAEVLLYCHPDLLDEYEGMYINLWEPELNTSIPPRREYEQLEKYTKTVYQAQTSGVPGLISTAFALTDELEEVKTKQLDEFYEMQEERDEAIEAKNEAVRALGELRSSWNDKITIQASIHTKYNDVLNSRDFYKQERDDLFRRTTQATWWQRLWKTW